MRYCTIILLVLMLSACGQRGALYFPGESSGSATRSAASTPASANSDNEDNDD